MHDKSQPFEAGIRWVRKETRDTFTFALKIKNNERKKSYTFEPGQFNMLYVPGYGEAAISISSAPADHDLLHTIRIAGDVTSRISKMEAGRVIGLRGPLGRGWPLVEAEDRDLMIVGGGIGIAPLRPVIRQYMAKKKSCPGRDMVLYGSKTPKDVLYRDEFPRYKDIFRVLLTVDKADPEEYWKGEVGFVTNLIGKVSFDPLNTTVFICGPEVMMRATIRELLLRGVPAEKVFLSMERNMNCGMGTCGHCFYGPKFVCKDGPVFRFTDLEEFLEVKEL